MEEKARQLSKTLKALANPNRLLILCALKEGPLHVSEIGLKVPNISQSAISQHLTTLKSQGILDYKKQGQKIFYYISDKRIEILMAVLMEQYCYD